MRRKDVLHKPLCFSSSKEKVNVEEMLHTIEVVKKLLTTESEQFEYIEAYYDYSMQR